MLCHRQLNLQWWKESITPKSLLVFNMGERERDWTLVVPYQNTLSKHAFSQRLIENTTSRKFGIPVSSHTSTLSYLLYCWWLQPLAEPEPHVPQSESLLAAWFCILNHTECIQLVTGRLRLLWCCICEVNWRVWCLCAFSSSLGLYLSPQGFDDQPGVEPQRLLSTQRCHHLLQPIAVQLYDLQVDTGSWGPQSQHPSHCLLRSHRSQLSSCPSSTSLVSISIAQPVFPELKHACTNRSQRIKNSEAKR